MGFSFGSWVCYFILLGNPNYTNFRTFQLESSESGKGHWDVQFYQMNFHIGRPAEMSNGRSLSRRDGTKQEIINFTHNSFIKFTYIIFIFWKYKGMMLLSTSIKVTQKYAFHVSGEGRQYMQ